MIYTYLTQLEEIAENTGWTLKDACVDAGLSDTTFYRWQLGITKPREKQAQIVAEYMTTYAR
tara:strand:+ start:25240 stop:25425 length:186 start_codon:yes stop_codon:yes gene_type:complete